MAPTPNNKYSTYYQRDNHIKLAREDCTREFLLDSAIARAAQLGKIIENLLEVPFSITFTGLSSDVLGNFGLVGNHAAIGYTIDPDLNTETVKWSSSSSAEDAATFGTGANPSDFSSAEGALVYLHVTDDPEDDPDKGPVTRTFSFPVRDFLSVALTAVGPQDSSGDVPLTYSTNLTVTGRLVVYYDDQPTPSSSQFTSTSGAYISQGVVTLTAAGAPIARTLIGEFDGSVRFAFLPNGGDDADVIISPTVTIDTTPVVPPNEWVISGTTIVSSPTVPVPVVSGTQIVG